MVSAVGGLSADQHWRKTQGSFDLYWLAGGHYGRGRLILTLEQQPSGKYREEENEFAGMHKTSEIGGLGSHLQGRIGRTADGNARERRSLAVSTGEVCRQRNPSTIGERS